MSRIQVKKYRKRYLTENKGNYLCEAYYLYLPKRIARPLLGKDLRIIPQGSGILIEPVDLHREDKLLFIE